MSADKIHVINTMFDGGQFEGVARNRTDDEVRLLFLSRFVKEKGVYELLTSFVRLYECYPRLRQILAGDGPEDE